MKKWTGEHVLMLKEEGVPVGILYENGQREMYKLKRATKEDVVQFLEVDITPDRVGS